MLVPKPPGASQRCGALLSQACYPRPPDSEQARQSPGLSGRPGPSLAGSRSGCLTRGWERERSGTGDLASALRASSLLRVGDVPRCLKCSLRINLHKGLKNFLEGTDCRGRESLTPLLGVCHNLAGSQEEVGGSGSVTLLVSGSSPPVWRSPERVLGCGLVACEAGQAVSVGEMELRLLLTTCFGFYFPQGAC